MNDLDVTILGGGCAGLSLACALIDTPQSFSSIHIVEPRRNYLRDRTWCFWETEAPLLPDAIAHRWPSWTVRNEDREHRASGSFDYVEVPADRFYTAALDRLARDPRVELRLGTEATATHRSGNRVRVETSRGTLSSDIVFDSRPIGREGAEAGSGLWQHFVGKRIRTRQPVFDTGAVVLMDFDVPQDRGIHFFYVLPYAPNEALVEATFFSPTPLAADAYDEAIDRYLFARYDVKDAVEIGREQGCLPMFETPTTTPLPGLVPIGITGGACRPSTGYAFLAIQRQARQMARWVMEGADLRAIPPLRSAGLRWMDRVFLAVLARAPERAPALFARLFEQADPDIVVRFLMEAGDLRDALAVARALPAWPFFREALARPPASPRARVEAST